MRRDLNGGYGLETGAGGGRDGQRALLEVERRGRGEKREAEARVAAVARAKATDRRRQEPKALPSQVSEGDLSLIRWIGEMECLSQDQVTRLRAKSPNTTRRWVRRYEEAGLLVSRKLLASHAPIVWLTKRGLYHAGLGELSYREPSLARIRHSLAVSDVRMAIAARHPEATFISERRLAEEITDGLHRPNGEVVFADHGKRVAVEVELTQKKASRLVSILGFLSDRYDAVWYFAAPEAKRKLTALKEGYRFDSVQVIDLPVCADFGKSK